MNSNTSQEPARCGGKKRDGSKCRKFPVRGGNGRCERHNGRAKRGVEHHSYINGKHSKYLPYPFADTYKEAQSDETLLSVRDEIALSDAMIMSLLPTLETGESVDAWKAMGDITRDLKDAYYGEDSSGMAHGIDAMENLVTQQMTHYAAYDAINKQADHRRKLVETEQKISLQGERAISVELFAQLMSQIFHVIETIVKDKDERIAVAAEVRQFITAGN